jgi:hypothetical protein
VVVGGWVGGGGEGGGVRGWGGLGWVGGGGGGCRAPAKVSFVAGLGVGLGRVQWFTFGFWLASHYVFQVYETHIDACR